MAEIKFKKSGSEIKKAVGVKIKILVKRLKTRDSQLEKLLKNKDKIKSYMIRSSGGDPRFEYGGGEFSGSIVPKGHISSEEIEEISQMCRRIYQLQQEIHRLSLFSKHLDPKAEIELSLSDLVDYGFEP